MPQDLAVTMKIIRIALCIGGILLFFRCLLPPLLPFLLALGISILLEPAVQSFRSRMKVKRSFAAVVLTSALLLIAAVCLTVLVLRLGAELMEWSARLPDAIAAFPTLWNRALDRLALWYAACPPVIRSALDLLADSLRENATTFVASVGGFLMDRVSSLAASLPGAGLFLMTSVLALYFTGISYSAVLSFLKRQLPAVWQERCRTAALCCRATIIQWLRSEVLLILATFLILLIGLTLMDVQYPLLMAVSVALVDALPVFGTGTVLLPWAGFALLLGDLHMGVALIALYAVTLLTHTLLEPRLLAGATGIPPLAMLLAIYLGFHLMGVGGMLLLPILLLLTKKLQDAGVIKLWK